MRKIKNWVEITSWHPLVTGQCTATGYGNIKTITPRGGNSVYMVATCDLCGGGSSSSSSSRAGGGSLTSASMPINGQVTDCF